jgi:formate dehydrogenase major subunit
MASKDNTQGGKGLSRRDFLKLSAAGAAVGSAGFDWAFRASTASAAEVAATYHTTCPYCAASCGQLVDVDASGNVLDIYGDRLSPINKGGLCAKGAGAFQTVTNKRRIGAFAGTHPVNPKFEYDPVATGGVAYKRTGNADWDVIPLDTAMDEIAVALKAARDSHQVPAASNGYNSKGVAFLGSSHVNNEQNYTYRKLIAQFGSSNTEHQARI